MLNQGHVYTEQIDQRATGKTVLDWLSAQHRHSSLEEWRERILRAEVEVDGQSASPERVLVAGETLSWRRPPWVEPEAPLNWRSVYEDEALIAADKPGGLPTLPGGGFLENTLLALVRKEHPEASPMHRLGRATSGLVLFAKSPEARSALQRAWRNHRVERRYLALGQSICPVDRLEISTPIGPVPHPLLGTIHAASEKGKPSKSTALVLERRADSTLFTVSLETGRPHQIRIHLASAGHPLIGDPVYTPGGHPDFNSPALPGDPGYFLHAHHLSFVHPTNGNEMKLQAPPPPILRVGQTSKENVDDGP